MEEENNSRCNVEIPYMMNFQNPLRIGTSIMIKGTVLENASEFTVNFGAPVKFCCWFFSNDKDIALSLSPHFDTKCIISSCTRKMKLEMKEITGNQNFPFCRGCMFFIEIFIAGRKLLIAINGIHLHTFYLRTKLETINTMEIKGDISLDSVSCINNKNMYPNALIEEIRNPVDSMHVIEIDSIINNSNMELPLLCLLSKTIECGDIIKIDGRMKLLPYAFVINLQNKNQEWPHPNIMLHINGRYSYSQKNSKKSSFVFNSWSHKKWGAEKVVSNGCLPLPGCNFKLELDCKEDRFMISIDRSTIVNFTYRLPLQEIKMISIRGDINVHSVALVKSIGA